LTEEHMEGRKKLRKERRKIRGGGKQGGLGAGALKGSRGSKNLKKKTKEGIKKRGEKHWAIIKKEGKNKRQYFPKLYSGNKKTKRTEGNHLSLSRERGNVLKRVKGKGQKGVSEH